MSRTETYRNCIEALLHEEPSIFDVLLEVSRDNMLEPSLDCLIDNIRFGREVLSTMHRAREILFYDADCNNVGIDAAFRNIYVTFVFKNVDHKYTLT